MSGGFCRSRCQGRFRGRSPKGPGEDAAQRTLDAGAGAQTLRAEDRGALPPCPLPPGEGIRQGPNRLSPWRARPPIRSAGAGRRVLPSHGCQAAPTPSARRLTPWRACQGLALAQSDFRGRENLSQVIPPGQRHVPMRVCSSPHAAYRPASPNKGRCAAALRPVPSGCGLGRLPCSRRPSGLLGVRKPSSHWNGSQAGPGLR